MAAGKPFNDYYSINDKLYPRVTSIIKVVGDKTALLNWMARTERDACVNAAVEMWTEMLGGAAVPTPVSYEIALRDKIGKEKAGDRASEAARNIGKQAHARLEWVLKKACGKKVGPEPVVSEEAMIAASAGEDFLKRGGIQPIEMEQTVWSESHVYAGTLDLLCNTSEGLAIIDFKTSKGVYPEHKMQLAAYRNAVNEMGHGPVDHAFILRLPKTTTDPAFEAKLFDAKELDAAFEGFLGALRFWQWLMKDTGKRVAA